MRAEHIIGLTAAETCDPKQVATIAQRFAAIKADGYLRPRAEEKPLGADGHLFELDRLAGDNAYVFLSVGERFRSYLPPAQAYGWIFDAADLVRNHGALVGPDLLQHYERLLEECVAEAAAALPSLVPISDAELAEFALLAGEDPAMLAYVREQSIYRDSDIDMAIRLGDMTEPGATEAVAMFQQRVGALRAQWRCAGAQALAVLNEGMEILVPGALPLCAATATIEGGKVRPQHTVFVTYDETERRPVVFAWDEGKEVFRLAANWSIVSGPYPSLGEVPHQPFTIEGWFEQPAIVRDLSGRLWLANTVPEE